MYGRRVAATIALVAGSLLLQYLPQSPEVWASELWLAPVENPVLVKDFLQPSADWSAGHRGVDYLVNDGDEVLATSSGQIRFSGRLVNRSVVSIVHPNGLISTVEPVCSDLTKGTFVSAGKAIGTICTDVGYFSHCLPKLCLHFGIKTEGGYLSPLYVLGELSPSRLKPWDGQIRSFV